ncbi:MAG: flagellar assembly protein FliW [Paenibacillaceae bacterium]
MVLETAVFGKIEIEQDKILQFPQGIPGFVDSHQFIIIPIADDVPFSYLQGVDNEKLSFLVVEPFLFFPSYEFTLNDIVKEELEIDSEDQVLVLTLISVQDDLATATTNLLAPLVINAKTATGRQIILHDTEYTTKHRLVAAAPVEGE